MSKEDDEDARASVVGSKSTLLEAHPRWRILLLPTEKEKAQNLTTFSWVYMASKEMEFY